MKNDHLFLMLAGFLCLGFLASCTAEEKLRVTALERTIKNRIVHRAFIYDNETEIVNTCIQKLTPKSDIEKFKMHYRSDMPQLSLFVSEKMLVLDSEAVHLFLDAGFNDLIKKLDQSKINPSSFNSASLEDFDSIHVSSEAFKNRSEQMSMIGGINFSRIVFSEDDKTAIVIFDFERRHDYRTSLFCAVELQKKEGSWEITDKVCLDKYPLMLSH